MTEWNGHSELAELAHLPPAHPARAELEARIRLMDPAGQERWRRILRDTDLLYLRLAEVEVPVDLQERLLRIPSSPAGRRGPLQRMLLGQRGWLGLAACALIAVGIVVYFQWPRPMLPAPLGTLDSVLAEKVASIAAQHCQGQASLQISSSDAGQVQAALEAQNLPVAVAVSPPRPSLVLCGGGTCDFGSTRAAYTRWQANGLNFTLFQFKGSAMCLPARFLTTTAVPAALGSTAVHYHVVIWPGNGQQGDWAMVLENDAAFGAFMTRNCR